MPGNHTRNGLASIRRRSGRIAVGFSNDRTDGERQIGRDSELINIAGVNSRTVQRVESQLPLELIASD